MPSRNRAREAAKARKRAELAAEGIDPDKRAKSRRRGRRRAGGKTRGDDRGGQRGRQAGPGSGPKRPRTGPMLDPSADENAEVRHVMAGDATKSYICPGCNRDIPPAVGHVVAVPPEAPDLRRHWHRGCWEHRNSRF